MYIPKPITYNQWRGHDPFEFNMATHTVVVEVGARALIATWTPELAQDIEAFHNIDAEAELTALLSNEIAAAIDREFLIGLRELSYDSMYKLTDTIYLNKPYKPPL